MSNKTGPATALLLVLGLAACGGTGAPSAAVLPAITAEEPTLTQYTPAEQSGLNPSRPYPSPDDVCVLLNESENVSVLQVDGRALIACPKHEKGALEDRQAEGAIVVGNATHWVILSLPAS